MYQRIDPAKALGYRGCAIGCTLPLAEGRDWYGDPKPRVGNGDWHLAMEELYGIDRSIADLIDYIFGDLVGDEAGKFALDVMGAVPVGADLTGVTGWARAVLDTDAHAAAELIERLRSAPVAEN